MGQSICWCVTGLYAHLRKNYDAAGLGVFSTVKPCGYSEGHLSRGGVGRHPADMTIRERIVPTGCNPPGVQAWHIYNNAESFVRLVGHGGCTESARWPGPVKAVYVGCWTRRYVVLHDRLYAALARDDW